MANIKITQLAVHTDPASTDVLPIIDVSADTTNKVSIADLLESAGDGTASAPGISFDSDSDTGIYRAAANELGISTGGTQRVVVDSSGRVGIGVSAPSSLLHIGSNDPKIRLHDLDSGLSSFITANNGNTGYYAKGGIHVFYSGTSDTERFRVTGAGNVGIGVSAPEFALDIRDGTYASNQNFGIQLGVPSDQWKAGLKIKSTSAGVPRVAFDVMSDNSGSTLEALSIGGGSSAGRVGIGTTNPGHKLDVHDAADSSIRIRSTGTASTNDAILALSIAGTTASNFIYFGDGDDANAGEIRYNHSGNFLNFTVNAAERMRITSGGNVGIGSSSPLRPLHINSDFPVIRLQDSDGTNQFSELLNSNGSSYYDARNNTAAGSHIFRTYNGSTMAERMRVHSNGFVGVGVTAPNYALHIAGSSSTVARVHSTGSGSSFLTLSGNTTTEAPGIGAAANHLVFNTAFNERLRITSAGRVGIGTTNPNVSLDVQDSGQNAIIKANRTDAATAGEIRMGAGSTANFLTNTGNKAFLISTANTERMRIGATGDVGIGVSTALARLQVTSDSLGTAANNTKALLRLKTTSSNTDNLIFEAVRSSAGTDWTTAAHRIKRLVDTTTMGYLQFGNHDSDLITFGKSSTEYFRITGSGRVGIGTSNPESPLHISAAEPVVTLQDSDGTNQVAKIRQAGSAAFYDSRNNTAGGNHVFRLWNGTAYAEKMRVNANGNVGINTNNPGEKLEVNGTIKATDINFTGLSTFADDSAAGTGGLAAGDVYKTSTGELRIKL